MAVYCVNFRLHNIAVSQYRKTLRWVGAWVDGCMGGLIDGWIAK
jgi:hypothetical protein